MLELQFVQDNADRIRKMLADRNASFELDHLLEADQKRRRLIQETEKLRAERKERSRELGQRKQKGEDISAASEEVRALGDRLKTCEDELAAVLEDVNHRLLFLPNLPQDDVPVGKGEAENPVLRSWGKKPEFTFKPKDHVELGEANKVLDFSRAGVMAGARFSLLRGWGARLERALIQFMLDVHTKEHGYEEMLPPFLVNAQSLRGTGNLPKFREDLFAIDGHDLFLIPTAEVPVTNFHFDEIIEEKDLPRSYVAYTPCFRSEAGSYGKDTRGLIRQHQFNKVEIVRFVAPETSKEQHELLTSHAEAILQRLELPYRVISLCTGDLGFSSSKTYDLEVWLPGQSAYREISSCSNFLDFQARRAKIRFRPEGGKPQLLHTLNGSGLAVGRTLIAILENYQQQDGSILVPKALQPYLDGKAVLGGAL